MTTGLEVANKLGPGWTFRNVEIPAEPKAYSRWVFVYCRGEIRLTVFVDENVFLKIDKEAGTKEILGQQVKFTETFYGRQHRRGDDIYSDILELLKDAHDSCRAMFDVFTDARK